MNFGFTEEQELLRAEVRKFLDQNAPLEEVRKMVETPAGFDRALWERMGELGWIGLTAPEAHGGVGLDFVTLVVLLQETGRSLFPSPLLSTVLAAKAIEALGSEEQQARWLQALARGEVLGAFALTEPDHGSDSVSLETAARRDGDGWVLRGAKKWIGNGASGGITFVWARVDDEGAADHGTVRCFLVEQDTPGYTGTVITGKVSLRGIHQAHIALDDVRVPRDAVLPGSHSFKDASVVLYSTRSGVAWSALGHATACYEAALSYSQQRMQFGKPLATFQMVQERLAQMLEELTAMQLYCRHLADLETSGGLRPTQASLAKYHNTRAARRIASTARDLLGGNGILLEYGVMQHLADIEAIHTYEGTESVQALLIGRDITGLSAFA